MYILNDMNKITAKVAFTQYKIYIQNITKSRWILFQNYASSKRKIVYQFSLFIIYQRHINMCYLESKKSEPIAFNVAADGSSFFTGIQFYQLLINMCNLE